MNHLATVRQVHLHTRPAPAYDDPNYWREYQYDLGHTSFCYGGGHCYSGGWIMDDFGFAVQTWYQQHGVELRTLHH